MTSPEAGAMHQFYAEHHGWLRTWLRRRLGCTHSAADLAQDTFVRVLLRPQVLSTLREPRAYLSTLAKGVVSEHWRRQALERAYLEALALMPEPLAMSPAARTAADARRDRRVGQPFELRQHEGLTYAAIAERLQTSERTVKRYMQQGFERCLALVA